MLYGRWARIWSHVMSIHVCIKWPKCSSSLKCSPCLPFSRSLTVHNRVFLVHQNTLVQFSCRWKHSRFTPTHFKSRTPLSSTRYPHLPRPCLQDQRLFWEEPIVPCEPSLVLSENVYGRYVPLQPANGKTLIVCATKSLIRNPSYRHKHI